MLSWGRLIVRSLQYHLRIHSAVALGVAAATAVLTGALIVGDSVRHSLRDLALDQLGSIDEILLTDRFFREELGAELAASKEFQAAYDSVTPVVLFPTGVVQNQSQSGPTLRAGNVLVVGCDDRFFALGDESIEAPGFDEIVINQPLADDIGVEVGDTVIVRLPKATDVPADSALAHKEGLSRSMAGLVVKRIVPAHGLGRFSMRPNQTEPRNAYVSMKQLQQALDEQGRVNSLLVVASPSNAAPDSGQLAAALRPRLSDYGLTIEEARVGWQDGDNVRWTVDYWSLSSSRMVFDDETDEVLEKTLAPLGAQPISTYMANTIAIDGSDAVGIPYSTVTGIDSGKAFSLQDRSGQVIGPLWDDEIVLNQWAAEQLQAKLGDTVVLRYFAPETTHGESEEWEELLKLKGIVPLTEPELEFEEGVPPLYTAPPTRYNDPFFTPTVEGITDEESISNWDPPFPYDSDRIRPRDDDYWSRHRTTPKAFVSMAAAQRLWDSRFGLTTSYRIPRSEDTSREQLAARMEKGLHAAGSPGFVFTPVRQQAMAASGGTTPFDGLFLALSFFIIAAALILVSLLFQLGVEQRAEEAGTLLAVGMTQQRLRRLWTVEGFGVAAVGAALGAVVGVAYAALMIAGLKSWWVGAIATPFLSLHITPKSLVLGYALGVLACVLTIAMRLRGMRRLSIRRLLAGEAQEEHGFGPNSTGSGLARRRLANPVLTAVGGAMALGAAALGFIAGRLPGGEAQAGGFVASGALLLFGLLLLIWNGLRGRATVTGAHSLGAIARRNASRNPTRSTMVIGLMAVASFLIVAMSAFRISPTLEGAGGFRLVGESALPVFADLNDEDARYDLFTDPDGVANTRVLSFRVKPGDDASCRNLYQSTRPRVLGVTDGAIAFYDVERPAPFQFAASAPLPVERAGPANPWRVLADDPGPGKPVPMVLDKNTAMYSLHLYGGIGQLFTIDYPNGRSVEFEVAGLLSNSVLQGNVLIGEDAFERLFPEVGGYRYFLVGPGASVEAPEVADEATAEAHGSEGEEGEEGSEGGDTPGELQLAESFEEALSDQGLDMRSTRVVLRDLLSVQNTYLSTFQSLGLLGLLLGTFGLATVQLRSVFERRRELALMRAAGFRSTQLASMVLRENLALLLTGLLAGAVAALVAVLPYGLTTGADIPWKQLAITLGAVLITGLLTGLLAVRATLKAPLVAALRGE